MVPPSPFVNAISILMLQELDTSGMYYLDKHVLHIDIPYSWKYMKLVWYW